MNKRFIFTPTSLSGLWVAKRKAFGDDRGFFARLFCSDEFKAIGVNKPIVQINHSVTHIKGTTRGLHFQNPPHAETKIISCLKGEVFDVAVDLRKGSNTFLSWHAEHLSAKRQNCIIIPEGFAHGFQALTDGCELIYLHTNSYVPQAEGGLDVKDKRIGINWPLPVAGLSERDKGYEPIENDYHGVLL